MRPSFDYLAFILKAPQPPCPPRPTSHPHACYVRTFHKRSQTTSYPYCFNSASLLFCTSSAIFNHTQVPRVPDNAGRAFAHTQRRRSEMQDGAGPIRKSRPRYGCKGCPQWVLAEEGLGHDRRLYLGSVSYVYFLLLSYRALYRSLSLSRTATFFTKDICQACDMFAPKNTCRYAMISE